jgi:NAD(P)-dependent dehydrogenase (short-subunit alcohol dehydrogenase family)
VLTTPKKTVKTKLRFFFAVGPLGGIATLADPTSTIMLIILVSVCTLAFALYLQIQFQTTSFDSLLTDCAWRNKVVVITGASSGIGADLARAYGRLGAHVVLSARRAEPLANVGAECIALGAASVTEIVADLIQPADCATLVDAVSAKHGLRLDALLLNHAISDDALLMELGDAKNIDNNVTTTGGSRVLPLSPAENAELAEAVAAHFSRVLDINFISYAVLMRLAMPALLHSSGHAALISSGSTMAPVPFHLAYVPSKFALNGLAATLRCLCMYLCIYASTMT